MLTFKLYKSGLYLTDTDISNPSQACVGFMFQDATRTDSTFTLSQKTWTDPNNQGYFAFFAPSSDRDWDAFATAVRQQFVGTSSSQFGWFPESAGSITNPTFILVSNQGTDTPQVQTAFSLVFRNVTLAFQTPIFGAGPTIAFNDQSNGFTIVIPNVSGQPAVSLLVVPTNGSSQTYYTTSQNMLLPMVGQQAGTVNAGFQFATTDLVNFEAGLMYFADPPPNSGQPLVALNYPVLCAPGGATTPMNFSAWLDVLQPLAPERSFFQLTDAKVGSYFASTAGKSFALKTVNGGNLTNTSRMVFANRPVQATTDAAGFYLTMAGQFQLELDTSELKSETAGNSTWLLCGVTGTEFLGNLNTTTAAESATPDALNFVPGQAAFRVPDTSQPAGNNPILLDKRDGNVTTSWVQYVTTSGSYVAQPEQSPLYTQGQKAKSMLKAEATGNESPVHVLDFMPLSTWTPLGATAEDVGPTASPAVPMVPYAGIPFSTSQQAQALIPSFLSMEAAALNPTRKNNFSFGQRQQLLAMPTAAAVADDATTLAMTPQGLLATVGGTPPQWQTVQIAKSQTNPTPPTPPHVFPLQFTNMGMAIQQTLQQNQVFCVISTTVNGSLFNFTGDNQTVDISDWLFSLTPDGTPSPDNKPPILILKFYPKQSIADLVNDIRLWSEPDTFNTTFTATQAKEYLQDLIQSACESVYPDGCPDGTPSGQPDTTSLYYNFYKVVTDPNFSGVLAVNCNLQLDKLPLAVRAVLGGMTKPDGSSNIAAFRAHHVGVQINDSDPQNPQPSISQSSLFGLVDYEKPKDGESPSEALTKDAGAIDYVFEVEYLRALFLNSELRSFSCKINLTVNNLFGTTVKLTDSEDNVIVITGSYQAHSDTGDDSSSGQGLYSFSAEGNFKFAFDPTNPYLESITLTKLQFSFQQETPQAGGGNGTTSNIKSRFSIWGNMVFKDLNVLDIFSFEKLSFADLGIGVEFDLTVFPPPTSPSTTFPKITFSPGDLRFDLAQTTNRKESNSLLNLIPFKLKSFLYSQNADQKLDTLDFYALTAVPGLSSVADTFNYALIFDLDLGSMGGLVGSLAAFKFSILIGWLSGTDGGIAFGVQLPQADGKLEIKIEGVFTLSIEEFQLQYKKISGTDTPLDGTTLLVLALHNSYLEIMGTRLPPGTAFFDFALFAPTDGAQRIGWIVAYNNTGGGGDGESLAVSRAKPVRKQLTDGDVNPYDEALEAGGNGGNGGGEGDSKVFELLYVGGGQRVGPGKDETPTNFKDFLDYMTGDFWTAFQKNDYASVYHPDANWLVLANFKVLGIVELGFVFYDYTPFYSLLLNVEGYFNFEITYTKISDSIGLYYINFALPDVLRTFQVGAASLTLPSIGVSIYTNGNWKLDVGFPDGDDWSRSFQVQAQAGPVPVTGSGGFYLASLSSATSDIFKGDYASILAFGFAARLGVGKDFTSGPLKAGISVTFFGIIEGAAGYFVSSSKEIFQKPDALSLKGQFGLIGEIYGSIDFKIIKASVNVKLQASIGIELMMEPPPVVGRSGTILLYVQASVTVSVEVSINLGLFSISISFSFEASFRFQWQLGGSSSSTQESMMMAFASRLALAPLVLTLCPGLPVKLNLWFLPEATVVFPSDTTVPGVPWFVSSLGMEYYNNPPSTITPAQYKPFEAVTAQLVTWALTHVLGLSGCSDTVTQEKVDQLDQHPENLVGWIDYPSLLAALAVFNVNIIVPDFPQGSQQYATTFPMPPFLKLQTTGRLNSSNQPDELSYQFSSKNPVSAQYILDLEAFFNQLFVNQTSPGGAGVAESADDTTTPLIQEIFLDYFTGLIRGAVHQLLQTMQDKDLTSSPIDKLIQTAVGSGLFQSLAGQMSSSFRGGVRLPSDGLIIPGVQPQPVPETYPLYALLWQEFPVGNLSPVTPNNGVTSQYTIALTNPDSANQWITSSVTNWPLTNLFIAPYLGIMPGQVSPPDAPSQLPFTNTGPQAFPFQNAIPWTQPTGLVSLRPFPSNLRQLEKAVAGPIKVLVQSRSTGAAYLPGGTPLQPGDFMWGTVINLNIKQVPGGQNPTPPPAVAPLPDIYALSGASQQDQALLEQILGLINPEDPSTSPVSAIQILYQTAAGATGLNSANINPQDVFVLRTNTTTVSAPPAGIDVMNFMAEAAPTEVSVGANISANGGYDFLQIIQQAVVTNAPGYYLRYVDAAGNNLPEKLFTTGLAPLTLLVTYKSDGTKNTLASPALVQPYYNSITLAKADDTLLYYANTTEPSLDTQYSAVAAGSVGVNLERDDSSMKLQPSKSMSAAHALEHERGYNHIELVRAFLESGVTHEAEIHEMLVQAGTGPGQLNALYSLITYQVEESTGFIESNLSAPIQPQKPNGTSNNGNTAPADTGTDNVTRSYRAFVPLYNLAIANQKLPLGQPPNRYASIGDDFKIDFFLNDAFGNQMPNQLQFPGTNYYFDPIIPLDQWLSVVSEYDFLVNKQPQANSFTVYLNPSATAFTSMKLAQAQAALQLYQSIYDQITRPDVSFYLETNLALQADNTSMVQVTLTAAQKQSVVDMVGGLISYLKALAAYLQPTVADEGDVNSLDTPPSPPPFNVPAVPLSATVTGTGTVPPVFELAVLFGIQRDPNLISPTLKDQFGHITFPSAQNVSSTIASTVGSSLPDNTSVDINKFAANFVQAFPALALSVGLNGAQPPQQASTTGLARTRLKTLGVAGDGTGAGRPSPQSLWAVQQVLLDISIGVNTSTSPGPRYMSPKPLDNTLNTALVPLPTLPFSNPLPTQQLFTDVDLDVLNRSFFQTVDNVLLPASAAQAFEQVPADYQSIARGRQTLAQKYSLKEVDWLFSANSPFTGTQPQLQDGQEAFEQQMRAALMTAYSVDTIVQYSVAWKSAVPSSVGDLLSLFGQVQPSDGTIPEGYGLSTAHVPVTATGDSPLTFLYGTSRVQDVASISLDLTFNVTHIEYFLEPDNPNKDQARASMWLQLVNPYPAGAPHVGPANKPTEIPLVFRQYPTPPTIINQSGIEGASSKTTELDSTNPITAAAAWHYLFTYQTQLTVHDQINTSITYNTDLSASGSGNGSSSLASAESDGPYSLFEALARFSAVFGVIQPILGNLKDPNWKAAVQAFASLVLEVCANTNWNPTMAMAMAAPLVKVTDNYVITDVPQSSQPPQPPQQLITLTWSAEQGQSHWTDATISIQALAPTTLKPYADQTPGKVPNGITDLYTPDPPLVDAWVIHQIEVDALNVLQAENALAGLQIERNLIVMTAPDNTKWPSRKEFIYKTPMVRPSEPVTPFVDYGQKIDVAKLPTQNPSGACPPSASSLCQRIYTMMVDLLSDQSQLQGLLAAMAMAGVDDTDATRRVKVACSFQYPIATVAGITANPQPVVPLVPVVLARSFDIDSAQPDQVGQFAALFAQAINAWSSGNGVSYGSTPQPAGAWFTFDITLYAQLSGLNTPVLRLSNLQLQLGDIDAQ